MRAFPEASFDLDLLEERSRLPFVETGTILEPWWTIACGNVNEAFSDGSVKRFVRRLFHDYDVVWGLYPDPDFPGEFEALLLDGGGVFTGAIKEFVDEDGPWVTAWHCTDFAQAKAIALAWSKDPKESMMLSSGVQHYLVQAGDKGGEVVLR